MVVSVHKTTEETILIAETREKALIEKIAERAKIESAFDFCGDCQNESDRMSSMPQGMFSARKIRENEERMVLARISKGDGYNSHKYFNTKLMELSPLKYNSKLMNSIWGLYNRYSPHNIKRTNDDLFNIFGGLADSSANLPKAAAPKEAATTTTMGKAPAKQTQNLPKIENIWNNISISQSH